MQRLHERFAFITIWDDHEFANDCFGANAPDSDGKRPEEESQQPDPPPPDDDKVIPNPDDPRRSASHRAWTEYMPVGLLNNLEASPDGGRVRYKPDVEDPVEEIEIYRSFAFGTLMELVVTDERLYRDGPPCGLDTEDRLLTTGCGETGEEAEGRTMLGEKQLGYFINKITTSKRTWKIWGNETQFTQLKIADTFADALRNRDSVDDPFPNLPLPGQQRGTDGVYFNLDQWDGYQKERTKITDAFKDVENFVVITGDLHTFIAAYVRENYDALYVPDGPPRMRSRSHPRRTGLACASWAPR